MREGFKPEQQEDPKPEVFTVTDSKGNRMFFYLDGIPATLAAKVRKPDKSGDREELNRLQTDVMRIRSNNSRIQELKTSRDVKSPKIQNQIVALQSEIDQITAKYPAVELPTAEINIPISDQARQTLTEAVQNVSPGDTNNIMRKRQPTEVTQTDPHTKTKPAIDLSEGVVKEARKILDKR